MRSFGTNKKPTHTYKHRIPYLLKFSFELLVFPLIPFDLIAGFVERVNVELRELGPDLRIIFIKKLCRISKLLKTYFLNVKHL